MVNADGSITLNLDLTKEELDYMNAWGQSRHNNWNGMSEEERGDRKERQRSSVKFYYSSLPAEGKASFSEKARAGAVRRWNNISGVDWEFFSKRVSEGTKTGIAGMSEEAKSRRVKNIIAAIERIPDEEKKVTSRKKSEALKLYLETLSEEDKFEIRRRQARSLRAHYASLYKEKREELLRNSFLSDESISKSALSNHSKPSMPELFSGLWIETNHPKEWAYTGDRRSMDLLRSKGYTGLKIPDYINIDGRKAVIEILGGLGWWHFEEEEEEKISYYKNLGFSCLVLFEWDCYDWGELEAKYKAWEKSYSRKGGS